MCTKLVRKSPAGAKRWLRGKREYRFYRGLEFSSWYPYLVAHNLLSLQLQGICSTLFRPLQALHVVSITATPRPARAHTQTDRKKKTTLKTPTVHLKTQCRQIFNPSTNLLICNHNKCRVGLILFWGWRFVSVVCLVSKIWHRYWIFRTGTNPGEVNVYLKLLLSLQGLKLCYFTISVSFHLPFPRLFVYFF